MSRCVIEKKKHFVWLAYFYPGLGKGSIWFYLELTLNLVSLFFFVEVLSLRQWTFNFGQNKNILIDRLNFYQTSYFLF